MNVNNAFMEAFLLRNRFNRIRYDRVFNVERTDIEELNNEMKNMNRKLKHTKEKIILFLNKLIKFTVIFVK